MEYVNPSLRVERGDGRQFIDPSQQWHSSIKAAAIGVGVPPRETPGQAKPASSTYIQRGEHISFR
ncbi:hypothetical protein AcV7_002802 [Taiwanofungus camphoratus]|nr:hypothetical protein AcV7_002802 [Antrodia cinnamomea]